MEQVQKIQTRRFASLSKIKLVQVQNPNDAKRKDMNSIARQVTSYLARSNQGLNSLNRDHFQHHQVQQWRGIRVKVLNGNLEQALTFMQRKMQSSGIERLIKREQRHHIKNSEKRVLARKNLERKIRSQDLARKLKAILVKKVRGL